MVTVVPPKGRGVLVNSPRTRERVGARYHCRLRVFRQHYNTDFPSHSASQVYRIYATQLERHYNIRIHFRATSAPPYSQDRYPQDLRLTTPTQRHDLSPSPYLQRFHQSRTIYLPLLGTSVTEPFRLSEPHHVRTIVRPGRGMLRFAPLRLSESFAPVANSRDEDLRDNYPEEYPGGNDCRPSRG